MPDVHVHQRLLLVSTMCNNMILFKPINNYIYNIKVIPYPMLSLSSVQFAPQLTQIVFECRDLWERTIIRMDHQVAVPGGESPTRGRFNHLKIVSGVLTTDWGWGVLPARCDVRPSGCVRERQRRVRGRCRRRKRRDKERQESGHRLSLINRAES